MRTIEESSTFEAKVATLFRSAQEADETVLFGVTWALARATFSDQSIYPMVGKLTDGRVVHALGVPESYFADAMLIIFAVSTDNTRATLLDISPMSAPTVRRTPRQVSTNGTSAVS